MKLVLRFCVLVVFLVMGGCDSGHKMSPLPADGVVLAFGDSLTYGTGAPREQSYPAVLAKLLGRKVVNAGIPGEITVEGLERLPALLKKHRPALVVLCHGGNDFLHRLDRQTTIDNLHRMIEQVVEARIRLVLVGVPKLGFGLDVPELYQQAADRYKVPFEDEILVDLLSDSAMKSDTIHPNAAGYQRMAEAIYRVIEKAQKR
ncbi:MAG: arylesterase [Desulfuromonas sp.]|nr:MAG: arylesterase [Desulfuromonas sp.]